MIAVSRPPKNVLYKFSANIRCCLFITSLSPRVHVPESHVLEFHVSESQVSESHVPESHVPESNVRESTSASPRPRVHVRESTSRVPVTESHVLDSYSQSRRPRLIFSHSLNFCCCVEFGGTGSFPYAVVFLIFGFPFIAFYLQNELLNRKSLPLVKKQPLPISRGVQHYLHFSVFF